LKANITIDQLVLNGFNIDDGRKMVEGIRHELSVLLERNRLPESSEKNILIQIASRSVDTKTGSDPEAVGSAVARSIFQVIQGRFAPNENTNSR
jgi:hypothetical protein